MMMVMYLDKHSEEQLRAELLDSLRGSLLVVAEGRLLVDLLSSQIYMGATTCTQTVSAQRCTQ